MINFDRLRDKLKTTRRGHMLLKRGEMELIDTVPTQISLHAPFEYPVPCPDAAFIGEEASTAVLADTDVLEAFISEDALELLPKFRLAGPRKRYRLNPACLRVGVLTAGGNAPGLDMVVDSIVKRHFLLGTQYARVHNLPSRGRYPANLSVLGIRGGYAGLNWDDPASVPTIDLLPEVTDNWALRGCTSLHSIRIKPSSDDPPPEVIERLAKTVKNLNLDVLYTIGGGGTLKVASELATFLAAENSRIVVVGGPKTMDNDIFFTDSTFGFDTAVENALRFLVDIHREAETLERLAIVELFGAASGFVAFHAAYGCGEADYALLPEVMEPTLKQARDELASAVAVLRQRVTTKGHALLVIAEHATSLAAAALSAEKAGQDLSQVPTDTFEHGKLTQKEAGLQTLLDHLQAEVAGPAEIGLISLAPRHLIRATPPNSADIRLCKHSGKLMVDTALSGFSGCAVQLWQNNFVLVPLQTSVSKTKRITPFDFYFLSMREKYTLNVNQV